MCDEPNVHQVTQLIKCNKVSFLFHALQVRKIVIMIRNPSFVWDMISATSHKEYTHKKDVNKSYILINLLLQNNYCYQFTIYLIYYSNLLLLDKVTRLCLILEGIKAFQRGLVFSIVLKIIQNG